MPPLTGDRERCARCGEQVEYRRYPAGSDTGRRWEHTRPSYVNQRHPQLCDPALVRAYDKRKEERR